MLHCLDLRCWYAQMVMRVLVSVTFRLCQSPNIFPLNSPSLFLSIVVYLFFFLSSVWPFSYSHPVLQRVAQARTWQIWEIVCGTGSSCSRATPSRTARASLQPAQHQVRPQSCRLSAQPLIFMLNNLTPISFCCSSWNPLLRSYNTISMLNLKHACLWRLTLTFLASYANPDWWTVSQLSLGTRHWIGCQFIVGHTHTHTQGHYKYLQFTCLHADCGKKTNTRWGIQSDDLQNMTFYWVWNCKVTVLPIKPKWCPAHTK